MTDYYTYKGDLRPYGHGTPIAYRYLEAAFSVGQEPEQGEMMAWDSTNDRIVRFVRDGSAGRFVGISRDSARSLKGLGNNAALTPTEFSVFTTGIHELLGIVGETYQHGEPVYMDATSTISITRVAGGGTQIGTVHNPQHRTLSGNVRVPVLIDEYTINQSP